MQTLKEQVLAAFSAESVLRFDAHCHYHWLSQNKVSDIAAFINTVTPQEFLEVSDIVQSWGNVGLGLHPWYVEECDVELFEGLLSQTRLIGEIGLDFTKRFTDAQKQKQVETFEKICSAMSDTKTRSAMSDTKIISVHTFRTQGLTHQFLKDNGVLKNCIVIYHWFGDGPADLKEAISDNCLFSVNERMLSTKKGAELAKMIPEEQLLFETDMPKARGDFWSLEDAQESIISAWQKWMKMVNATSK